MTVENLTRGQVLPDLMKEWAEEDDLQEMVRYMALNVRRLMRYDQLVDLLTCIPTYTLLVIYSLSQKFGEWEI
jgi:hypothetical protein